MRNADGTESLILIELQKTWLTTETLRFRQYLGTQYLNKENIIKEKEKSTDREVKYGLPIVSIYILGHCLGGLREPVIYVRRHYLDYDGNTLPGPDRFIESLTHDSIIVQIPLLPDRTRNHLEKILSVFNQKFCTTNDVHYLEINDNSFKDDDSQYLVHRLLKAAATPDVRRAMEVEDEILSEIEERDTTIMLKNEEIEQKKQEIEQKEQVIRSMVKVLYQNGMTSETIATQLSMPIKQVQLLISNAE